METILKGETVTVTAGDISDLLEGAITHAHQKLDLPILNTVRLEVAGGHLTAISTDRYRLIQGEIARELEGDLSACLVPVEGIKRILSIIKGEKVKGETLPITLNRLGDILTVSLGGNAISVDLITGTYPPVEKFLDFTSDSVAVTSAAFNPAFFADYAKIAVKGKGKFKSMQPVEIEFTGEGKPMRITITGERVSWKAVLMPMRIVK
jgi:DNA polymerase III sliding clamp (beta) subunit (PCNA family)